MYLELVAEKEKYMQNIRFNVPLLNVSVCFAE